MDIDTTRALLGPVLTDLTDVLAAVTADQEHDPTPCTELDVAALRGHVVSWLAMFASGLEDPEGVAPDDVELPADPVANARDSAARIDAAVRAGGSERPLVLHGNGLPGDLALGMLLWEYQVHGWDLARATDQPWAPSDEAAQAATEVARQMLTPGFQGEGKPFGPPVDVPADAPVFERLLGLSGRDPGWTPPA